MGAAQSNKAMCTRGCINSKGDGAEFAVTETNDAPYGPSRKDRISRRLSNTPEMKQLVHHCATFRLAQGVPFAAARSSISEAFHEWLESAIWILYDTTGENEEEEYPTEIPSEIRGPQPVKEIVEELLAMDDDHAREQRLRSWLVPQSAVHASTTTNIFRRLRIDDLAPDCMMRLSQYDHLLKIFDNNSVYDYMEELQNATVSPGQIVTCVEITHLLKQPSLGFVSFTISLAAKLKKLVRCEAVRMSIVYESADLLWNVFDDNRVQELEKLSESGYVHDVRTGAPSLKPNLLVVPGLWSADGSNECFALFACYGKGDSDSEYSDDEEDFDVLDMHMLTMILRLAGPRLWAGRVAAKLDESIAVTNNTDGGAPPARRRSLNAIPMQLIAQLLEEQSEQSGSESDWLRDESATATSVVSGVAASSVLAH